MKRHSLDYHPAYELVRAKRRFVQPNAGFVAQLKLFRRMGYKIDPSYQRYKMHRLRLAGEQMRKAKILPQSFHNVVRPDPDITREMPEPIVFRCRRCRRVLASKSHVLEHRARSSAAVESGVVAAQSTESEKATVQQQLEQLPERLRKASLGSPGHEAKASPGGVGTPCRSLLFVEPIAWMPRIMLNTQGRLYCPKCEQKLGSFSWVNGKSSETITLVNKKGDLQRSGSNFCNRFVIAIGSVLICFLLIYLLPLLHTACQCPCGETMTPAFYLIPSKVELSKAVQNVQTTV